jgi:hypothetical protein
MKNKFYPIVLVVFFAFLSQSFSQGNIFTVISAKKVQLKKGGVGSWINLAVGNKLNGVDIIKANSGGISNLLYINGKVVKFNQTKETKVSSLEKKVKFSGQDLAGQIARIANERLDQVSKISANIGGVRETETVTKDVFLITPRRGTKVLNTLPVFIWNHMQNETEYQLIILNDNIYPIQTVFVITVKDTIYNYTQNNPALDKGTTYVCIVNPLRTKKQSEYQTFTTVTDSEYVEIKKRLDLTESLSVDADELGKCIVLAMTYEDLGLYADAYLNYITAIKLAPKEEIYKKMLTILLIKTNLIKQAVYLSGYNLIENEQK